MKLILILLIITSCCYTNTAAQVITDNGTSIIFDNTTTNDSNNKIEGINLEGYTEISAAAVENSPFIKELIDFGSQYVIGNIADSRLVEFHTGNYSEIYSVYQHLEDTLNVTANVNLHLYDGTDFHAIFLINNDPSNSLRRLLFYSYELQNYSRSNPSGINITYDASQDLYQVLTFSGIEQTFNYQNQDLSNQTTIYSGQDFLHDFANFTPINVSNIYSNQTLQLSFNAALRGLRQRSYYEGPLESDYDQLNVSAIHTIDSYIDDYSGDYYYRYDFEFNTANQSGRVVCAVSCPDLRYYDDSDYPTYYSPYPKFPLNIGADGSIVSSSISEDATSSPNEIAALNEAEVSLQDGEPSSNAGTTVDRSYQSASEEENENMTAGEAVAPDDSEAILPDSTQYPSYYYPYNCLYATLNYYWFVNIQESA